MSEQDESTFSGINVPPSTKVRIAQRTHLLPKTFHSVHDAQKHSQEVIDAFKKLDRSTKEVGKRFQEMTAGFGPESYQLEMKLSELTGLLSDATTSSAASAKEILGDIQVKCKNLASLEPGCRRAHKEVGKALRKFEIASRKQVSDGKISDLGREVDRKTTTCGLVATDYNRRTLGLGLHMVIGQLELMDATSYAIIAAAEQILGSRADIHTNSIGGSLYEDARPCMASFECPVDSADSVGDSSSFYGSSCHVTAHVRNIAPTSGAKPEMAGPTEPPSRISRPIKPLRWSSEDQQEFLGKSSHGNSNERFNDSDTDSICSPWK